MNSKWLKNILPVLLVFMQLSLVAQVSIERSDDKVVIGGKAYYIHIVDSSQTLYSLSRAYNVNTEVITRENPAAVYGLRIGQALKIPVAEMSEESIIEKDLTRFNYHVLQKGESIYSLSKKYDLPEERIIEANKGIDIYDLPVGTELAIPKKAFREQPKFFQTQEPGVKIHEVKKGENFSSISRLYQVSIREIRRANKGLLFPREGDLLKIPVKELTETEGDEQLFTERDSLLQEDANLTYLFDGSITEYTEVENLEGKINFTLMLPLYLDQNSERSYIDSTEYDDDGNKIYKVIEREEDWIFPRSELFVEFYEGVILAVQDLRSKGLDVEMQVFDTMRDSLRVSRYIETGRIRNTDLIIGPVYNDMLEIVARYARRYRIPVVSPLWSRNTEVLRVNPYLFKVQPSLEVVQKELAETISEYWDHNLVFIHSDTTWNAGTSENFKNLIFRSLMMKAPYDEISFKEVTFATRSSLNDTINIIEHAMSKEKPNLVILASDDAPVENEVIINVHSLLRNYDIKLIGYPDIRWLPNLDPMYYYELGIIIHTPNWVDYNAEDVRDFLSKYKRQFKMEPPIRSYAWQSYDITYYFISGLAIHGSDFMYRPQDHRPDLLQVHFDFKRAGLMNGFENNRLYLIRYTPDFRIEFLSPGE